MVFQPLWQMSQETLLRNFRNNIESIITGVAAEPFDDEWLGREIDLEALMINQAQRKSSY